MCSQCCTLQPCHPRHLVTVSMRDTIVIGAGLAGLMGALALAEAGRKPLVLAKGQGATHWTSGTIDVWGGCGRRRAAGRAARSGSIAARPPLRARWRRWRRAGAEPVSRLDGGGALPVCRQPGAQCAAANCCGRAAPGRAAARHHGRRRFAAGRRAAAGGLPRAARFLPAAGGGQSFRPGHSGARRLPSAAADQAQARFQHAHIRAAVRGAGVPRGCRAAAARAAPGRRRGSVCRRCWA